MESKLLVLDSIPDIKEVADKLADINLVAYDIETTGVHKGAEVIGISLCFEEESAYYIILAYWDCTTATLVYNSHLTEETLKLLNLLKTKQLIMHNGVFDAQKTEDYFAVSLIDSIHTDTMILAHLLDENRRIGLKELGKQYFGEDADEEQKLMKESVAANGGTLTKANYEMYKADPQLLGRYGAKDALLTYKLFYQLVPELYEQGLEKFFYEDECMPLLKGPTYQLNGTGLKVDMPLIGTLKKQLEAECIEAKAYVLQQIEPYTKIKYPGTTKKNRFNIGSSSQLTWLLFGELKLEFGTLTKEGKNVCRSLGLKLPYAQHAKRDFIETCLMYTGKVYQQEGAVNGKKVRAKKIKEPWSYIMGDKKTLTKYKDKYKWVERLLEYQKKTKILNTYVEGISEQTQYGIIHPSFLQTGTTSGRYSSRAPNFQNLPRDDKRIKQCIIARPGKVFVGADYSQLEPRVFAYTSGDKNLLEAFSGTNDFYSVIGMKVYGKFDCTPQKEGSDDAFGVKYKKLRDLSKVIALATVYGATPHQLAPTTSKSIEDTAEDIQEYLNQFPGVAKMMTDSHAMAKADGQVKNLFGRPRRIPEAKRINKLYGNAPHAELPYEARTLLNLATNHRIQSTSASIVNRAMIAFHNHAKSAQIVCKMVVQVHDSIVIECDEVDAENVALLLQHAMEETTTLEGIKLEAIPKVGTNLSEV